jgi:hypothetical protein
MRHPGRLPPYRYDAVHYAPADRDGGEMHWFAEPLLTARPAAFPHCRTTADVEDALVKAGVVGPDDRPEGDPEEVAVTFPSAAAGRQFVDRLNDYLAHKSHLLRSLYDQE